MENLYAAIIPALLFLVLLRQSRNYLLSFFAFTAACAFVLCGYSPGDGAVSVFADYLYAQITDPVKAAMVVFIALYCGYVGTMEFGGPIKGFTRFFEKRANGKTGTQLMAWFSSVGAFFSDLGSPGIVGTLFRRKYNEESIPRERLALLINLTAVPVCSMIPLVGWGLFAVGILYNTVTVLDLDVQPIALFLKSVPYFCFSFLAILTPLLLLMGERFQIGALRKAERELAEDQGGYLRKREDCCVEIELAREEGSGWTLCLSVAVMLCTLFFFLNRERAGLFGEQEGLLSVNTVTFLVCLGIAFVLAALSALVFMRFADGKPFLKTYSLYTSMFKRVLSVTGIMVMSWIFFEIAWKIGLYQLVGRGISRFVPGMLILPLIFLAGCLLSARTGSAWGTYAVMIPLAVLLCADTDIGLFAAVGAAVSGSVYGDISSEVSHAMHYSAESAGVDPDLFRNIQTPYVQLMAAACTAAYGLGYYIRGAAAHLLICTAVYLLLIQLVRIREGTREGVKEGKN